MTTPSSCGVMLWTAMLAAPCTGVPLVISQIETIARCAQATP
jgi:hypothetical protein